MPLSLQKHVSKVGCISQIVWERSDEKQNQFKVVNEYKNAVEGLKGVTNGHSNVWSEWDVFFKWEAGKNALGRSANSLIICIDIKTCQRDQWLVAAHTNAKEVCPWQSLRGESGH